MARCLREIAGRQGATQGFVPKRPKISQDVISAESALERLAQSLGSSVDGFTVERVVALSLGMRGWSLYRGFRHALTGSTLDAAQVDLRALMDVTILTRWIEGDPALRVDLWFAEDARLKIVVGDRFVEFENRRGHRQTAVYTESQLTELREEVASARKAAQEAGLPMRGSSLLPTAEQMAQSVEDLWEVYNVAYRNLSPWTHAGGRSFTGLGTEKRDGKLYLTNRSVFQPESLRALALSAMCLLLASVSRQVGLNIHAAADTLRLRIVFPEQ